MESIDIIFLSNTRIIQTSYPRTGSTLLVNILNGLFTPNLPVVDVTWDRDLNNFNNIFEKNFVVKTHKTNIKEIAEHFSKYDLYFIESTRKTKPHSILPKSERLLTIDYEEFIETAHQTIEDSVQNVVKRLKNFLPNNLLNIMNVDSAVRRIKNMNMYYEIHLKDIPFDTGYDVFYHLHGSHRNRS